MRPIRSRSLFFLPVRSCRDVSHRVMRSLQMMQFETLFLEVRRLMLETSSCESLVGVGVANADQGPPHRTNTEKG